MADLAVPSRAAGGPEDPRRAAFARQVRDALAHLHDFPYLQTHPLTRLLTRAGGARPASGGRALHDRLLEAVASLDPPSAARTVGAAGRVHELLRLRYAEALPIPEVCARLGIGQSEYYREHRQGVDTVASLLWEGLEASTPRPDGAAAPASGQQTPANNLPVPLTSFVGREREIDDVTRLLESARLVTLTGTGGCGKTRLALRVGSELLDAYADGVWLVDLAPVADEGLVPPVVLTALGLQEAPGRPAVDVLTAHLRGRTLLLILDNCEHIVDACARLADVLLQTCPGLRILATSRELLGIVGETAWRVSSLAAPDPRRSEAVESVSRYEAVRLFVERARAVRPDFALTEANAAVVAQVCRRLDGIPLALELAAARIAVLPVEQIAERLDDRFRLLTGGSRTALRRQQTLRAAVDWSHDLLSPPERAVLRRLSVFAGGCGLEAAEAVCAGGAVDAGEVLDLLAHLAQRSLLLVDQAGGEARYRLLETMRQYAGEKLLDAGEAAEARDRHLGWCLTLVERAATELHGPRQLGWLDRLAIEHDNLRAALRWATASGAFASGLRLGAVLGPIWWMTGRLADGYEDLGELLDRSADSPGSLPQLRAEVLAWAAYLSLTYEGAGSSRGRAFADEALALGRAHGAASATARALQALGMIAVTRDNPSVARPLLEEARAVARAAGDRSTVAWAVHWLGVVTHFAGETAAAEPLLAESVALGRAMGDRWIVAHSLEFLGVVAYFLGDHRRARELLGESLSTWEVLGSRFGVARDLRDLARIALTEGDLTQASRLLGQSLPVLREVGTDPIVSLVLDGFAGLAAARGQAARALRLASAAAEWREARGMRLWVGEQPELDRWLAPARAALGPDGAAAAWAEGQAMMLEQALEEALSEEV